MHWRAGRIILSKKLLVVVFQSANGRHCKKQGGFQSRIHQPTPARFPAPDPHPTFQHRCDRYYPGPLQRNWMWNGLDRSFADQTHMMADIHHYAWRAKHLNQTVYLNERDLYKWVATTAQGAKNQELSTICFVPWHAWPPP